MCPLVRCQVRRLCESLVTAGERTYVWLFACMSAEMRSQVEIQRKPLAADVTFVRLLSLNTVKDRIVIKVLCGRVGDA